MRSIGGLWMRESKDGKKYASGKISTPYGDIDIVVFNNDKKDKENQPDKLIYLSEKKERVNETPVKVTKQNFKDW